MTQSPYLKDPNRLADVIAAIQVMGIYKFYKLGFKEWADRISGDESEAEHWRQIFIDHPEFFRLDQQRERASLVWRRTYPKAHHIDTDERISKAQLLSMNPEEQSRVSRKPLSEKEVESLINTAISLHSSALEHKQEKRWWLPLIGFVAGLLPFIIDKIFG